MGNLSTSDGQPTGAVYGFVSVAFEIIRKMQPDYVIVAWDKKGTSTDRRTAIYPEYKAGRKRPPEDFYTQIPFLMELLEALGWPLTEHDGYEADDIMGTLSEQANRQGISTYLITSDLDMLQLIDHDTSVFALKRGFSQIEEFNLTYFEEKYGLRQAQFLDLKALQGDSSDNIPGVPGIGPKTATTLLQQFGTLDNIYNSIDKIKVNKPSWAKKLEAGKDLAFMSKELAKIWCDVPVELNLTEADINNFDHAKVIDALKKFEFRTMIGRIPSQMKDPSVGDVEDTNQASLFAIEEKPKLDGPKQTETISTVLDNKDPEIFFDFNPGNNKTIIANFDHFVSLDFEQLHSVLPKLTTKKVIFYQVKEQLHLLDKSGIQLKVGEYYDIEQMAFLLNALIRDKSLTAILGVDFDDSDSAQRIAAMIKIYQQQLEAVKEQPQVAAIARELDFPLTEVLFKMEKIGVKISPDFFEQLSRDFGTELDRIEKDIYSLVNYEFNIASPKQLSSVLFEILDLPTKGIKKSRTGYSTGQKELNKLRGLHPIIELIEQYREYAKLKSTYIDALPKLADENDRVHSTFNQDVTTTGRLSSTNPNLQNIPIRSELGRKIRRGFVAEKGNILISGDYSQFELRLAAIMSDDKPLIETFNSDVDIHNKTASEIYGVPMDEVTSDQRRAAKIINFSVLYGAGPHNLSQQIGVDFNEAKKYIDDYFAAHQPIRDFMDNTLKMAKEKGYVETFFGRRRPTPDILSKNFMVREMAKRAAANMPVQGTEADLMKRAMIKIDEKITQSGLGEQILQIHDSILIEAPEENAEKITDILRCEMENVAPELNIKLKVDISRGTNWFEL